MVMVVVVVRMVMRMVMVVVMRRHIPGALCRYRGCALEERLPLGP